MSVLAYLCACTLPCLCVCNDVSHSTHLRVYIQDPFHSLREFGAHRNRTICNLRAYQIPIHASTHSAHAHPLDRGAANQNLSMCTRVASHTSLCMRRIIKSPPTLLPIYTRARTYLPQNYSCCLRSPKKNKSLVVIIKDRIPYIYIDVIFRLFGT